MVIIVPRIDFGATSDRYRGAVKDAIPTDRPTIIRETISMAPLVEIAQNSEPSTKQIPLSSSETLRPRRRVRIPDTIAPAVAPPIIEPTTQDITVSST